MLPVAARITRPRACLVSGVALALLALLAVPTHAYVRTQPPGSHHPARWPSPTIRLELDVGELPAGTTAEHALSALQRAAGAWSHTRVDCTAIDLTVTRGQGKRHPGRPDHVNSVGFHTRNWCPGGSIGRAPCHDKRVAAITTVHFAERLAGDEIAIAEADIELNAVHFAWSTDASGKRPEPRRLDLQSVLTHELGHVLGFGHPCEHDTSLAMRRDHAGRRVQRCRDAKGLAAAVMALGADLPGAIPQFRRRGLGRTDVAAACGVYPAHDSGGGAQR